MPPSTWMHRRVSDAFLDRKTRKDGRRHFKMTYVCLEPPSLTQYGPFYYKLLLLLFLLLVVQERAYRCPQRFTSTKHSERQLEPFVFPDELAMWRVLSPDALGERARVRASGRLKDRFGFDKMVKERKIKRNVALCYCFTHLNRWYRLAAQSDALGKVYFAVPRNQ